MELKNLNILNVFKTKTFNEKSLALLVLTLLPAMFVTKSFEATVIYVVLYVIFIIITSMLSKLIRLISEGELRKKYLLLSYVVVAILLSQFVSAFYIPFGKSEFLLYIYLFPITALPYLIDADNEAKNIGRTLVDGLQSVLVLVAVLLVTAFLRELIGTGGINFTRYFGGGFSFDLFSKYSIAAFSSNYFTLIILGFYASIVQFCFNRKMEVTK